MAAAPLSNILNPIHESKADISKAVQTCEPIQELGELLKPLIEDMEERLNYQRSNERYQRFHELNSCLKKSLEVIPNLLRRFSTAEAIEGFEFSRKFGLDYLALEDTRSFDDAIEDLVLKGRQEKVYQVMEGIETWTLKMKPVLDKWNDTIINIQDNLNEIQPFLQDMLPLIIGFIRSKDDEQKLQLVNFITQMNWLDKDQVNYFISKLYYKWKNYYVNKYYINSYDYYG